jgi:hypothetical protein
VDPGRWEPTLERAAYSLARNLGFSRDMLAGCVHGSRTVLTSGYEYRCQHLTARNSGVVRVAFTVRPRAVPARR